MNQLTIIGNLTRDPELRTTQTGVSVCTFTVAVNRRRFGQNQGQPEADFFRVTAWRELGENCAKYLLKGRKVCVEGSVQVRSYDAKDGTKRQTVEISADEVEFLSSPTTRKAETVTLNTTPNVDAFDDISSDDLPWGS